MAGYKKILVAYDGSVSARNAFSIALRLAKEDKSLVKVLAVAPSFAGDLELIGIMNIKEIIEIPCRMLLEEAMELAARENVNILTDLEQGEPYDRIVNVAEEEDCDLIIVGRRGLSKLERELMGGVTSRVIGHTKRNVLVVPEKSTGKWDTVMLATDGSANSDGAVELALDIVMRRSARLVVVTVVPVNDEVIALAPGMVDELTNKARGIVEKVRARAVAVGGDAEIHVWLGEPHRAIVGHAKECGATLIVMGSHGRKGLHRLLMGSVTERTIGYASCPVMVAH